ncbi:hypothetical protein [Haladaptatus sp. CMAA 1911]|uniref:hypothetical protein n=1 Tax=unclassified Haladaptatus TaxID=2622732 RepID=UPI003753F7FC
MPRNEGPSNRNASVPTFERLSGGRGVRIWDPIEKVSFVFRTPSRIEPRRGSTEGFPFPIDTAVEFRTDRLDVPCGTMFNAWDESGTVLESIHTDGGVWTSSQPVGFLEVVSAPIRLYIAVGRPVTTRTDGVSATVELAEESTVRLGVRSYHESPAGSITVTDDVEDVMRAVSRFGSALKTLSPERSFPTLRGHPPLVERGEEFSLPPTLERPDTGVRLVVPPKRKYVYPAASLAYYLGAEVVPGCTPRLETPNSEHSLDGSAGFEWTVSELLQHVFFCDCLLREEGFYPAPLHVRSDVESLVDFDFADLYDRSLSEQLEAYLSVPFDRLEPHRPVWNLVVDVEPTKRNAEALPYVSNDLALVRCPETSGRTPTSGPPQEIADFCRSGAVSVPEPSETFVSPEESETLHHEWLGDGVPIGSNKVTLDSYRRRIEDSGSESSTIDVRIVCNDPKMAAEGRVTELYEFRETTDHDIDIRYDLSVDELRSLFAADIDFLHYIGHVDGRGIECRDGVLDTTTLDEVRVRSFLLNACRSYHQSMALIEKGSRGGIATLSDVSNAPATEIGSWLARLLGRGYTLRNALSVARTSTLGGDQYVVLGDGETILCQTFVTSTTSVTVDERIGDTFPVTLKMHVNKSQIGSYAEVTRDESDRYYLIPGTDATSELTADELDELFELEPAPVEYGGELYWSAEITAADLH